MESENCTNIASPSKVRRKISAATINAITQKPHPKLSYVLYTYREKLRSRKSRFLHKANSKLTLTRELMRNALKNIDDYTTETFEILDREKIFAQKLKKRIEGAKKRQLMKTEQHAKQKEENIEKLKTTKAVAKLIKKIPAKNEASAQIKECKENTAH